MINPFGYVAAAGHRWWLDPKDCSHANGNVCASCDFDRYYADTYESVPWRSVPARICWCAHAPRCRVGQALSRRRALVTRSAPFTVLRWGRHDRAQVV